jgi:hypothetical protein
VSGITEFERQLLSAVLGGDHPVLEALRAQLADAVVDSRETSESGFMTHIKTSGAPADVNVDALDDLQIELAGAASPAEVILHLDEGRITALECALYDGAMPDAPRITSAWFYGTKKFAEIGDELFAARDVEGLLEE